MKIKAGRKEVLTAINRVVGGVDKRSTIPILSHVLLDAGTRGTLRISASDLNTYITTSVKVGIQGETGSACVPADKIKKALDKLGTEVVEIELDRKKMLIITGDDSRLELSTLSPDEFPCPKEDCSDHEVGTLPGGYIHKVLGAIGHAIGTDESRYNLCGIHFCVEGNDKQNLFRLTTAATDGHRLSVAAVDNNDYDLPAPFILPTKVAKLIGAIDCNQGFYFSGEGLARFSSHRDHETDIKTSLIDGDFPDFRHVIPNHESSVLVDSEKLTEALELCGVVAEGSHKAVTFELDGESLKVSSLSDTGVSQVVLPVQNDEGKTLNIKLNSKYTLQAINALDSEEIFIKFKDGSLPLLLVPVDNEYWDERLEVLMPLQG